MSLVRSVRGALPMTFAVYVAEAGFALGPALWLDAQLGLERLWHAAPPHDQAFWLERLVRRLPLLLDAGPALLVGLLAFAALTPLLAMGWLYALRHAAPPRVALFEAARLYPRSLGVTLAGALTAAVLVGALLGARAAAIAAWAQPFDARLQDLIGACTGGLMLLGLWLLHVFRDLAQAQCLQHGALRSLGRGLRLWRRPRLQAAAAGWTLLGACTLMLALPLAAGLEGRLPGWGLSTPVLQAAIFARLLCRACWLAVSLESLQAQRDPDGFP